jgi:hypothetical protein
MACVVVDCALAAKYLADDAVLDRVVDIDPNLPPSRKVLTLLDYIERNIPKTVTTDESFLPGLSFLRPTARQVLEKGGDCADRSRLLVELLKREGVRASKVALYDRDGVPQHAVVEADIEDADGEMVVDALYGIHFPDSRGGYYSVSDIRDDESILVERLRAVASTQPYTRDYPVDQYTYASPRTINWDKSWAMQQLYRGLFLVMGPRVDRLERPAIVGDPVLMTLVAAVGLQLGAYLAFRLIRRVRFGRTYGAAQTA